MSKGETYYDKERAFLNAEWREVAAFRAYPETERQRRRENIVGLALSGGGIRSASFALGILQALARRNVIGRFDYLSSVSGGGYIGSALTWFLHNNGEIGTRNPEPPPPERNAGNFPIGEIYRSRREDIGGNKRAAILNFIRQHGNYLIPGRGLNLVSLVSVVLRSVLLSFFVYFSLLVIALQILGAVGAFLIPTGFGYGLDFEVHLRFCDAAALAVYELTRSVFGGLQIAEGFDLTWLLGTAVALLGLLLFSYLVYALTTFLSWRMVNRYRLRTWAQRLMGWLVFFTLLAAFLGSLPFVVRALEECGDGSLFAGIVGVVSTVLGGSGTFLSHLKGGKRGALGAVLGSNWYLAAVAALLLYGLLILGYSVAAALTPGAMAIESESIWAWGRSFGLLALALVIGFFVNLNYVSLHRMYRDRLMETFLPNPDEVKDNVWHPASQADQAGLWAFARPGTAGPYHLINTNVVLADSRHAKYSGRGGDSFILSPGFCGSDATGWRRTGHYMRAGMFSGMTLATAMAISGAAVNPNTGVGGQGITRNRLVSFLMTLLNLRLGYWAPNPNLPTQPWITPNFFDPGFKALWGKGMDEDSRLVELTDGGHFDNIGIYELIRRRAKVVVVSDGTADSKFSFSDFGNVVERVRVDFGVTIRFRKDDCDLRHIMPHSAEVEEDDPADEAFRKKYPLAERGFAIGQIEYPGKERASDKDFGVIVYIKSTLTKFLPADIYGYKSRNPEFPDQSTADQFFDETQLEAYRELGYRLAKDIPWDRVFEDPASFQVTT